MIISTLKSISFLRFGLQKHGDMKTRRTIESTGPKKIKYFVYFGFPDCKLVYCETRDRGSTCTASVRRRRCDMFEY